MYSISLIAALLAAALAQVAGRPAGDTSVTGLAGLSGRFYIFAEKVSICKGLAFSSTLRDVFNVLHACLMLALETQVFKTKLRLTDSVCLQTIQIASSVEVIHKIDNVKNITTDQDGNALVNPLTNSSRIWGSAAYLPV